MKRDCAWWLPSLDSEEAGCRAGNAAQRLIDRYGADQVWHTQACIAFYDASERPGTALSGYWRTHEGASSHNVIQSVIDTFVSHTIRSRVRLMFLTQKGNREERKKAQGMTQVCEAAFDAAGLYGEEGTQVCRDGCRDGMGVVKVTPDYENSELLIERCLREELFVDRQDARLGKPRQLIHRIRMDRAVAMARWPEMAEEIERAPSVTPLSDGTNIDEWVLDGSIMEQVEIWELWHLPSSKVDSSKRESWERGSGDPSHDGRHMILLANAGESSPTVLMDEPWPLPRFPFAFFRVKPRAKGFDGRGFVETLRHLQTRINRKIRRLEGIEKIHGTLKLYLNRQANVRTARIATNDWTDIVEGDGPAHNAVQHLSPPSLPADYLATDGDVQQAWQMSGLNELAVFAERPKSMQSGEAVRSLRDSQSVRHTDIWRAWESFFKELGFVTVDALRLLAWNDPDFAMMWDDAKELRVIKWRDVDLQDMKWKLQIWPTSLLPSEPAAKLERAMEMYREKAITREQLMLLLDYPDIKAISGGTTAALRNIEVRLDHAEKGDVPSEQYMPHGFMALNLAMQMGLERLNDLEAEEADPEVIDRVQRFLEDVQAEMKKAQPMTAPTQQGAPALDAPPETATAEPIENQPPQPAPQPPAG